jgi:hypothetical protein
MGRPKRFDYFCNHIWDMSSNGAVCSIATRARRIGWRPSVLSGAGSAAVAPVVAAVTIMIVVVAAVAPIIVIPITIILIVVVAVVLHLLRRSPARGKCRGGQAYFHRL